MDSQNTTDGSVQNKAPELTYGQKAVGLTFNPGGNPQVNTIKQGCADLIDLLSAECIKEGVTPEKNAILLESIRQIQTAQMWAVKGVTYPF